jgi:hypothetical protein
MVEIELEICQIFFSPEDIKSLNIVSKQEKISLLTDIKGVSDRFDPKFN